MTSLDADAIARDLRTQRRESARRGYLPPDDLVIDPSLKLHLPEGIELDAISYEVIRSKLWNLNVDHSDTIKRTSGSSFVAEANDFNVTLMTELGEGTAFGPYAWFFAGYADLAVKWTLEHRSSNPGIAEGDVFIHDDPWVGTNHASDVVVIAPVFWEGELFAWLFSCAHHRDVGGPVSGSVNPNALSAFEEPSVFPPTKLVDQGVLREDVMEVWTRRSRLPEIGALELKSQLAGINFGRERLIDIVERYGAAEVKQAMYKGIEDSSRVVADRLSSLPDGAWRDEMYLAGAGVDDSNPYKMCLTFEKRGSHLHVSNAGTDPAVGALNQTVGAFRGSVVSPLFHALGWDIELCGAGLIRQIVFELEEGKINSATHPSSVGSSIATNAVSHQAGMLASKMVSGHPEFSRHAIGASAIHTVSFFGMGGVDQYGAQFAGVFLDMMEGGSSGWSNKDGIDHSGGAGGVITPIPDVEEVERSLPVLCMYRHELPESGAHGRFRGGAAVAAAFVGHGAAEAIVLKIGLIPSLTLARGVDGAWPATGGTQRFAIDSAVRAWFETGRMPVDAADIAEVAPAMVKAEKRPNPFGDSAVYQLIAQPGGGYGDPVTRAPAAVVQDLRRGRVTAADALKIYGVVASPGEAGFDEEATESERRQMLGRRVEESRAPREVHEGSLDLSGDLVRLLASVGLSPTADKLACLHCGQLLADADGNFRLGCCELEITLPSISPLFDDPDVETGDPMVFRQYLCPSCGTALDGDICKPADVPYASLTTAV